MDEAARQTARDLRHTTALDESRRRRKKVEMLFAHLKRHLKMTRLRLQGIKGATEEFLLAATAQNLKRLSKLVAARMARATDTRLLFSRIISEITDARRSNTTSCGSSFSPIPTIFAAQYYAATPVTKCAS